MKNDCAKWKDQLLESALTKTVATDLQEHLSRCPGCSEELAALCARRERLDALLPFAAQVPELPAGFRTRVMTAVEAASEAERGRHWQLWGLAGAMAVIVATLMIGLTLHRKAIRAVPNTELAAAQKLAEWRAPSDVLLETPGQEILQSTPKFGKTYLKIPVEVPKEK